ncbi:hypothetical protein C8R47DRAFT_969210 [Mycena vitilis]|nr:hypothetical protein C8R47DRAFT_969210 [Mycena vitilis]
MFSATSHHHAEVVSRSLKTLSTTSPIALRPVSSCRTKAFKISPPSRTVSTTTLALNIWLTLGTAIYQSFSPKLYAYTENATDLIFKYDSQLRREFPGAYSAAEFDLGDMGSAPRLQDRDLLHGWRALTALGNYDSRYGGDIILWDDGFIIRFPPGATILLPAAIMRYSFVNVRPGEKQYAFSQYSPGGLYRYITNGYVNDATFENDAGPREMEAVKRARGRRFEAAMKMYSTIDEFVNT